jgi:hypothetical protein
VQRIIRAYDEHKARAAEQQTLPLVETKTSETKDFEESLSPSQANDEKRTSKFVIVREEMRSGSNGD